jgi:hypothetical protein
MTRRQCAFFDRVLAAQTVTKRGQAKVAWT